jgi:hypothetical protein
MALPYWPLTNAGVNDATKINADLAYLDGRSGYTDADARAAISNTITGLTYDTTTGVWSLTPGYVIPLAGAAPTAHAASHAPSAADTVFPAVAAGWLHSTAGGALAWTTPTYTDVGAAPAFSLTAGYLPKAATATTLANSVLSESAGNIINGTGYFDSKTFYYINGAKIISIAGSNNLFFGSNVAPSLGAGAGYVLAIGANAGASVVDARSCVYIGANAGNANINTYYQLFIGTNAGVISTGQFDLCIGDSAGASLTNAGSNVCIGFQTAAVGGAGLSSLMLIGYRAGYNCTGSFNTAIGTSSLFNVTGQYNVAIGYLAGSGSVGGNNILIGSFAGVNATNSNTIIGFNAGRTAAGSNNILIGYYTGYYESGSNTFLLDNRVPASEANGRTNGLMYGLMTGNPLTATLRINAKTGFSLAPTAWITLPAGTTVAGTAPLKFTSGSLLTTAEAGAFEFLTDDAYLTITTGAARKNLILGDGSLLTDNYVPVAHTNGRLINSIIYDNAAAVGINRVPETWDSLYNALQIGGTAAILSDKLEAAGSALFLLQNAYYDGDWKRIIADETTQYIHVGGSHIWLSDASGTADTAFTPTERMRLTAAGNLGIGIGTPNSILELSRAGTAKANLDLLTLTNTVNAADMDGTATSILFRQYYYDASTPAVADLGRITFSTVNDWVTPTTSNRSGFAISAVQGGALADALTYTLRGTNKCALDLISIYSSGTFTADQMTAFDLSSNKQIGRFATNVGTSNGMVLSGFRSSYRPLTLAGYSTGESATYCNIELNAYLYDGATGVTAYAAASNILTVNNNSQRVFDIFGDGTLHLSNSTTAHGMTTIAPTDCYFIATYGGIKHLTDDASGFTIDSYIGSGCVGPAVIALNGYLASGTGSTSVASTQTLLNISNYTTPTTRVLGDGTTNVYGDLYVHGYASGSADKAIYLGPLADGNWRIVVDGNDLSFQRRESGAWVEKGAFTAS